MPKVIIIMGMPGSGKSAYLCSLKKQGKLVFDDFHGGAIDNLPDFEKSQYFAALKKILATGNDCFITDIMYCYPNRLTEARSGIQNIGTELGVPVDIEEIYFENEPQACIENAKRRSRVEAAREIADIEAMTKVYVIPPGAQRLPVWQNR